MTTQSGVRPLERHLIFMNFSAPMSAPKPASVTTKPSFPTSLSAMASAITDEFPCAMFAKGPAPSSRAPCETIFNSGLEQRHSSSGGYYLDQAPSA